MCFRLKDIIVHYIAKNILWLYANDFCVHVHLFSQNRKRIIICIAYIDLKVMLSCLCGAPNKPVGGT